MFKKKRDVRSAPNIIIKWPSMETLLKHINDAVGICYLYPGLSLCSAVRIEKNKGERLRFRGGGKRRNPEHGDVGEDSTIPSTSIFRG